MLDRLFVPRTHVVKRENQLLQVVLYSLYVCCGMHVHESTFICAHMCKHAHAHMHTRYTHTGCTLGFHY